MSRLALVLALVFLWPIDTPAQDSDEPTSTCDLDPSTPRHDPATTVTMEVHGWNTLDGISPPDSIYGGDRSDSPISDSIRFFSDVPCGLDEPEEPNQSLGTRYYGSEAPDYYSDEDIDEVEKLEGIPRYSLVVAKHAREVIDRSGATGINFVCHSMGTLVVRYLIENDLEGLVTDGLIARWVTVAGVVDGADLARTFKDVVEASEELGIDLTDVEHMNPAWVEDNVAICDGEVSEANNPAFGEILIHHIVADDSTFDDAFGLPLLDLLNPDSLPNDGILFSAEQQFQDQAEEAQFVTVDGESLSASRTYHESDHFAVRESLGAGAAITAALLGTRRIRVTLDEITLLDDREKDGLFDFSETGFAPAEVVLETEVAWPYLDEEFEVDPLVGERDRNNRVVPVTTLDEDETVTDLGIVLYDAPLLDGVDEVRLALDLREVDWYPTFDVTEWIFDADSGLGSTDLVLAIETQTIEVSLSDADLVLEVEVFNLAGGVVFRRGDVNASGEVTITDALAILEYLFADGEPACLAAADVDASGSLGLVDALDLLFYLFLDGETPPPPHDECGDDPDTEFECGQNPESCP